VDDDGTVLACRERMCSERMVSGSADRSNGTKVL
jgi:hypothetical protein